jgi:hypothetical protein
MCQDRKVQFEKEEEMAAQAVSGHKLINQDKYVGIERSRWTPREPMPLKGWAETVSGKFSPAKPKPAIEVITLERQKFKDKTIYPKGFPIPVVCAEFCENVKKCNLRGSGFDDLCKYRHKIGKLVHPVDVKWSVRFNMQKDYEQKSKTKFVKSSISVLVLSKLCSETWTDTSEHGSDLFKLRSALERLFHLPKCGINKIGSDISFYIAE